MKPSVGLTVEQFAKYSGPRVRLLRYFIVLSSILLSFVMSSAHADDNALMVNWSVPATMTAGSTSNVYVWVKNTGTTTWPANSLYRLGAQNPQDNNIWGVGARVNMPQDIKPGDVAYLFFVVTAPSVPGTYNFQWRMVHDGVAWFGPVTPNVVVTVTGNTPTQTSQSISFSAIGSQTYSAGGVGLVASATSGLTVSFASNTLSTCTVSGTIAIFLSTGQCSITAIQPGNASYSAAPPVTRTFSINSAVQSQSITFNSIANQNVGATINTNATASSNLAVTLISNTQSVCTVSGVSVTTIAAGTCSITASQPGNAQFSAAASVTQTFTVSNAPLIDKAIFVNQIVPATMNVGQTYAVSVTMQNTGTSTWTSAQQYLLGAQNPIDSTIWNAPRAQLPASASVAPNQTVTISFNVTAPTTAGIYNLQYQMLREYVAWFGAMAPNVQVQVVNNNPPPPSKTGSVTYTYDSLGRLWTVTYSNGVVITYSYDAAGNRKSTVTTGVSN